MRTELRFGAAAVELERQLNEAPDQMLILGVSDLEDLQRDFAALFTAPVVHSMMIVYRPLMEPVSRASGDE